MRRKAADEAQVNELILQALEGAGAQAECVAPLAVAAALPDVIADDFARAYESVDAIVMPTSPCVAFPFGDKTDDPLSMYLCDIYTIPTNLAGHPAMSVPFGTGAVGLPVGMQVLAPTLGEVPMFRVAGALERAAGGGPT